MATQIFNGRYTAQIEGDFVVFLIGARLRLRDMFKYVWMGNATGAMLAELDAHPELGFLGGESFYRMFPFETVIMSYWRSFDHLEQFARDRDLTHLPAWQRFYKDNLYESQAGIWHETYLIRAGEYETIYGNMPKFGLANARDAQHVRLDKRSSARERAGLAEIPDPVAEPALTDA